MSRDTACRRKISGRYERQGAELRLLCLVNGRHLEGIDGIRVSPDTRIEEFQHPPQRCSGRESGVRSRRVGHKAAPAISCIGVGLSHLIQQVMAALLASDHSEINGAGVVTIVNIAIINDDK